MGADPLALDPDLVRVLSGITTATLTTVLLKKGLRNVWMRGTRPLQPGQPRLVGRAFTLRFVPAREDLATPASWGAPISTRAAIEAMPAGRFARRGGCRGSRAGKAGGLEGWIMSQVDAGTPLPGLYPPNEETKARYEAWARTVR